MESNGGAADFFPYTHVQVHTHQMRMHTAGGHLIHTSEGGMIFLGDEDTLILLMPS